MKFYLLTILTLFKGCFAPAVIQDEEKLIEDFVNVEIGNEVQTDAKP